MKKLNFKKTMMISASALMLLGIGAPIAESQTVQAAYFENSMGDRVFTANDAYKNFRSAGLVTPKMTKGPVKIHWYKTAHVKPLFNNVNVRDSWDASSNYTHWGNGLIIGYATINGRKYYINYNEANQAELVNGEDLHRPTIMHGRNIVSYGESVNNDDGFSINSLEGSVTSKANQSFIIPTHHNPVTLPCTDDNQDHEFVPVFRLHGVGDYGPSYILKSDFDRLKAGTVNGSKVAMGLGAKVWNKNGLAYSSEAHDYAFKAQRRRVNRILKGHKTWGISKRTLRQDIIEQINGSWSNLKETGMTSAN